MNARQSPAWHRFRIQTRYQEEPQADDTAALVACLIRDGVAVFAEMRPLRLRPRWASDGTTTRRGRLRSKTDVRVWRVYVAATLMVSAPGRQAALARFGADAHPSRALSMARPVMGGLPTGVGVRIGEYSEWLVYNEIFVSGEDHCALDLALDRHAGASVHIVDFWRTRRVLHAARDRSPAPSRNRG